MYSRLEKLSGYIPEYADGALIISNENRRYFTNFVSSLGYLLVTRKESYLFADSRYSEAAKKQAENCIVIEFKKLSDSLCEVIQQNGLQNIMLESDTFTLTESAYIENMLDKVNVGVIKSGELNKIINTMRLYKTEEEIQRMQKAQDITEKALNETLKLVKEGVSERDIALELEFKMRKMGAEGVSFDLIVLSGKKTSMPHGVPDGNEIKNGDFLLFDIGATYEGYHSDMTRTYAVGKISDEQKKVYETVRQAQQNALDAVKDGMTCGEIDKAAREYIYQSGYEGYFGHSTGHGVGLEIHEVPSVSPNSDFTVHSGMVITIEPGIYIPDKFGVRIEDMIVVTDGGYENFVSLPKELIVI